MHPERIDHVRGAEDARDRDAQGARRGGLAGEPAFSKPGRAGGIHRRAGGLWAWDAGHRVSQ